MSSELVEPKLSESSKGEPGTWSKAKREWVVVEGGGGHFFGCDPNGWSVLFGADRWDRMGDGEGESVCHVWMAYRESRPGLGPVKGR